MTPNSLSNTIYLDCLAFMITMFLTASGVEGKDRGESHTQETSGVVGRAYNSQSVCYNSQKKEVKCTKKKGIIIGSVIGILFLFLGGLFLYGVWSDRWRKRKGPSTVDENEPLSDVSSDVSDCGKGVTKAGKDGDHPIPSAPHLDKSDQV